MPLQGSVVVPALPSTCPPSRLAATPWPASVSQGWEGSARGGPQSVSGAETEEPGGAGGGRQRPAGAVRAARRRRRPSSRPRRESGGLRLRGGRDGRGGGVFTWGTAEGGGEGSGECVSRMPDMVQEAVGAMEGACGETNGVFRLALPRSAG